MKERYFEILDRFGTVCKEFGFDGSGVDELKEKLKKSELIVPVVGAFSCGKSSLINSFLGRNVLPTGITPETSLATELRFGKIEKIEAIGKERVEEFEIDEFDKVKSRSKEFKFLRVWLNSEDLKEIEPFVLVDMPGFDSPVKLHNEAIVYYLSRGVHFIVLISAEDGGISKSLMREIENILEFRADVSVALSKCDLLPKSEVLEIKEYLKDQLEDELELKKDILLIDSRGLKEIILSLDIDDIYKNLFLDDLKVLYFEIEQRLNSYKSALSKSNDESLKDIEELKKATERLKKKRDRMIEKVREKYSNNLGKSIVDSVINEVVLNQERLIEVALRDRDVFERELNEIIRHKLILQIKRGLESVSESVIEDFSIEINDLKISVVDSKEWIEEVLQNSKRVLQTTSQGLETVSNFLKKSSKLYKTVTTILGITTTILNPILEVAVIFLPEIVEFFTKGSKLEEAKRELRIKFKSEIVPSLKMRLEVKVDEILDEQISLIVETVSDQFEKEFSLRVEEISRAIEAKQKENDDILKRIDRLEIVKNELQDEMNKLFV